MGHRTRKLCLLSWFGSVAVLAILLTSYRNRVESQKHTVQSIEQAGGVVYYNCEYSDDHTSRLLKQFQRKLIAKYDLPANTAVEWLGKRIGYDYFCDVISVDFFTDIDSTTLDGLTQLPRVKEVNFYGTELTASEIAYIEQLRAARRIGFYGTPVRRERLKRLAEQLPGCQITSY